MRGDARPAPARLSARPGRTPPGSPLPLAAGLAGPARGECGLAGHFVLEARGDVEHGLSSKDPMLVAVEVRDHNVLEALVEKLRRT